MDKNDVLKQEIYIALNYLKEGKFNACEQMLKNIAYFVESTFFCTLKNEEAELLKKIFVLRSVVSTHNVEESKKYFNDILNTIK